MDNGNLYMSKLRSMVIPRGPYNITPYFAENAQGARVYDISGKELIDFAGGIGVMNVGHSHPKVVAAIKNQADKFTHTCWHVVMYGPYVELADKVCEMIPGSFPKMAIFCNSGAEAVENAVKIARYHTKRPGIIAFEHAFHGRTYMGMSLTSKSNPYKYGFGPMASDIYRMPYPYCYRCSFGLQYPSCGLACAEHLKHFLAVQADPRDIAALIAEPVCGEGGFITPPLDYFLKIQQICREHEIVFIADEIQSGIGRTGKMLAMEHFQVEPDMTTLAKSLAAGMPLSAVVGKREIMDSPGTGSLGGTYSGNPVSCAAALAVLEVIEEDSLLSRAEVIGNKLHAKFAAWHEQFEIVGDVRGLGAMVAMELVKDRESKEPAAEQARALIKFSHEKGLILLSCGTYGNVIRTLVPLVADDEELERGLAIIEEGLTTLQQ